MSEKQGYKYKVSTSQSVSSGIIAVSVDYYFDSEEEFLHSDNGAKFMRDAMDSVERTLDTAGYKLAKNIVPKEPKEKKAENG